ncbi:MAG TPA: thiamine pyrophosphate-dependent dehydrogenase E1 component subunit alpha [Gaiellaceae bacterium]|nr:thiamine pyrophosphate-dependent dehydrogenase E1 component subunit alpha [Gaiellaceae bacterium]
MTPGEAAPVVPVGDPHELYRLMRLIRRFEERVVDLVNANEIAGVTHESVGQEAVAVGVCSVLRRDDVITSTHRGHGHLLAKGADPARMMSELLGRVSGTNRACGGSMHVADFEIGVYGANGIVGAGAPWAAGAAWAAQRRGRDSVAVSFFGDGAVNQGVLLETLNLASLWRLPVVFVCENNGYAVTTPALHSTAGELVGRAQACAIPAHVVDGMDVAAVRRAAAASVEQARGGGGPSFLECRTYRFFGHHTAERTMGLTYRTDEEIESWRARDPVAGVGASLEPAARERIDEAIEALLDEAVALARAAPRPDPEAAYAFLYASPISVRRGSH